MRGYGGLSYVGGGNGTQVGAAADRTPSNAHGWCWQPGTRSAARWWRPPTSPYPEGECRPTRSTASVSTSPDEIPASSFIEHETIGCANPEIHLLEHKAYHYSMSPGGGCGPHVA